MFEQLKVYQYNLYVKTWTGTVYSVQCTVNNHIAQDTAVLYVCTLYGFNYV